MFSTKIISKDGPWSIVEVDYAGDDSPYLRDPFIGVGKLQTKYTLRQKDPAGIYRVLIHEDRGTIMANTPVEVEGHLGILEVMTGRVLIGGLGIGMILDMIFERPDISENITEVVILENQPEIIRMVGPKYKNNPKVNIVLDDIDTADPKNYGHFDVAWFDHWDDVTPMSVFPRIDILTRWAPYCDIIDAWMQEKIVNRALRLGLITRE